MEYISYFDYLNLKHKYKNIIRLKYLIYKNNRQFIKNNIKRDIIVRNNKLDIYQKEAIFTDEINTLVLAGAGSGKTLTIEAKIRYLIEEKNIKENEILCISFTNETVNNLKEKIDYNIDIYTFHKLAIEIIKDYKLYYSLTDSDYLEYIIREIFYSLTDASNKSIEYFVKRISSFINLLKVNNLDELFIDKLIKKRKDKLLVLIRIIYLIYENELSSLRELDFNDLINYSIKLIREKGLKRYYKYIIVDEFQDISLTRSELLKEIIKSCNSHLFAVGDDYQTIYKFAGSKIDIITSFKKYFGYTKIIKLRNTYRNSNELIKASCNFISKNKNQINKKLVSNKHSDRPIKIIYYSKNINIKFNKLVNMIGNKVLILSRNNYDFNSIDNIESFNHMTIHKSKGLEEDNIIVLNMVYGIFPSIVRDDLNELISKRDKYKYEEERRLFYVALTRTKNNVYLFVDKDKPSVFVKELFSKNSKYIEVLDL